MTTYADPTRCPDCRSALPHDPQVCPACSLPLTGQTVVSLFTTLQEADRLLGVLRAQKGAVPAAVGASSAPGSLFDGVERYPAPRPHDISRGLAARVRGTSVPTILL